MWRFLYDLIEDTNKESATDQTCEKIVWHQWTYEDYRLATYAQGKIKFVLQYGYNLCIIIKQRYKD
jgi:hypothetical protein